MRVLMLSKACIVGIYQRKLELIAQEGVELLTLVPPAWKDERGTQSLERVYTEGYTLESLPIWFNGNFHLHVYPTLGRYMREFKPDIVHIDEEPYNASTWQALYLAKQLRAKTLFFSWQNIRRDYPFPFSTGERWVMNNIDYALVGTDSAGDVWREKGYTGPMMTIPQFGTDPDLFHPATERPQRPFTIGYIGRLVAEKGLNLLFDAVAGLPRDADWHLRLTGSGPLRDALQTQAAELGIEERVTFTDWIPSTAMPSEYHQMDVVVLPSLTRPNWKEQFGRVLVEAMGSGIPVIGSDSGAIPGVIGDGGIVVPENDVDALKGAIQALMHDPQQRATLAEKGRARVLAHFTHISVAEATVRVYQSLLEQ